MNLPVLLRSPAALLLVSCIGPPASAAEPLLRAHAHNDYRHQRPLLDALEQGFCSVEADIFLVEGKFRVGHSKSELRKDRTLESLYLKPLAERVRANKGSVYPKKERFILLIDIKSDGDEAYPVLDQLLTRYQELFNAHLDGKARPGPIMAILSGNRPRALLEADGTRYCSIDGRPPDLGSKAPSHLVPLVSDNWSNHFKWRGRGEFPPEELAKLKNFVARTHKEHRLLRFWAVPDNEACWRVLYETGVDLINTDKLSALSTFLGHAP
jgi:hypothetical protein